MLSRCLTLLILTVAGGFFVLPVLAQDDAGDDGAGLEQQSSAFSFDERVTLIDELFRYDSSDPVLGHWHGNVFTANGVPAASILIERDEDGEYRITCSVTPGNRPHQSAQRVKIIDRRVQFHAPLHPPEAGALIFDGLVSQDGQRMNGTVDWPAVLEEQGSFELARTPRAMDLKSRRAFGGDLEVAPDIFFEIVVCLAQTPAGNWVGHLDIPRQDVGGWVLDRITTEDGRVQAHMGGGSPAVFDGQISTDGARFSGTYLQGSEVAFVFNRIDDYEGPSISALPQPEVDPGQARVTTPRRPRSRPQYPIEPSPYQVREVQVQHQDKHVLAGSLTMPLGDGPFPGVVLLTGAGPHDRDNVYYGHKWFLVLADHLARQGIASLRCDDRGIAGSTGRFSSATTHDFATDAAAMYNFMRAIDGIDLDQIGFVGHGEGGLVATLAAPQVEAEAFVALLAPMGVSGAEYMVAQTRQILSQVSEVDTEIRDAVGDAQHALLNGVAHEASAEELSELAIEFLARKGEFDAELGQGTSAPPSRAVRMILAELTRPWRRAFLAYDPLPAMQQLECPVLAMWGSMDIESDPGVNRSPIVDGLAGEGPHLTERVYEGLNHLFQPATTGRTSEYARSTVTMSEQVMGDLSEWILAQGK